MVEYCRDVKESELQERGLFWGLRLHWTVHTHLSTGGDECDGEGQVLLPAHPWASLNGKQGGKVRE